MLTALFLARLRFCVHYCIDRDAVQKNKNHGFFDAVKKKNRVGLSTKKLRMIWKQDNQTNVVDLMMWTLTTYTNTDRQTDT